MENRAHALAAGLFTLLLAVAGVAGLWWLGQGRDDVDYYLLATRGNVTGLNLQAQVRYRGIRAGRVESIGLDPADAQTILVQISLDERFRLTRGTTAQLNTQGVTGLAYVMLEDDGRDPRPLTADGGAPPRIVLAPSLLDTFGDRAGELAVKAGEVADRLARLLDDKNLGNLARSLDNLATASEGLKQLPQVMAALRETLSDANLKRLSAVLAHLEQAAGEAAPLTVEMRGMVRTMNALAARFDRLAADAGGELTGETLPRANALLEDLAANSRQLARLLDNLERNPQALVFGRPEPRPGPGEAGFGQ